MIKYEIEKLDNGLRVIYVPITQTNAVTVLMLVNTGSRFETKAENGISHFLEHMFFKGTASRPSTMMIANELDGIGASYNAFTSEEYTGFYVRCSKNKYQIAIDILGDIIQNSLFDEAEIIKEKGVIIEEINMYEDLPQKQIFDITKEHFYGDTPLGRSTLGTKNNIKSFDRNQFINYKSHHYLAKNSVVVIAGNGTKKDWKEQVVENFSHLDASEAPKAVDFIKFNKKNSVKTKYKKTDQAHMTIGINTLKRNDDKRFALKLVNNILGETMSSRLFTEVREKRGLAYYVGSDSWYFADCGALVAFAGVDTARLSEAIKVISEQIRKIANHSITKKELQKAKDNIEGKMYLGLEDSFSVAEFLAEHELLYNKIISPEEIVKKIKAVTLAEANDIILRLVKNDGLKLSLIGPYKSGVQFEKLIK